MNRVQRLLPMLVLFVAVMVLLLKVRLPQQDSPYDLQLLARVPVSGEGRVKPLDTVARTSLMIISGRQTFELDGKQQPAIRWLADVIAQPQQAEEYEVFRIDHPEVLGMMGIKKTDRKTKKVRKRFSYREIIVHGLVIQQQAHQAGDVDAKDRSTYQNQVLKLFRKLRMYNELQDMQVPYAVPPLTDQEQWTSLVNAAAEARRTGQAHVAADGYTSIWLAYNQKEPNLFSRELARYRLLLDRRIPNHTRKADYEVFFNHYEPFYQATVLYLIAFLLACFGFLLSSLTQPDWSRALGRSAVLLLLLTLVLHTFGLVSRMYLQGRPPVTNLYSSAVFIGWGGVALGLIVERFSRMGLGSITAALVGFVTLIIAHNLGNDGDTMQMMQAVLDTNLWLATHVVAVTIGYLATFVAGLLAIFYIGLGVFTKMLDRERVKVFGKMVYGVICFALLLSFVGTVLGGIWADQSWGRFWGWDPKENGAVLIVLMNVLILHARWGGMIRQRGMMVLAVLGNIVTSWSWFGTNMLGVGLHAYGFMDSAAFWLILFVASQLLIMSVGLLPLRMWRSFAQPAPQPSRTKSPVPGPGRVKPRRQPDGA